METDTTKMGSISVPNIIALKPPNVKSSKQSITLNTKIEIRCETPETDIFYTTDGTKPEPFSPFGAGKSATKYIAPFLLPPGKITIKAVAYSKDGSRESRHVSKTFFVEGAEIGDENNNNEQKVKSLPNSPASTRKYGSVSSKVKTWNSRKPNENAKTDPVDIALASAIICASCCAPRPKSSSSKFCNECGTLFPDQLLKTDGKSKSNAVPALGTMGMCVHCRSYVPLNIDYCIVCEAPIKPQLPKLDQMQATDKLQCPTCGSLNPLISASCLVCEGSLHKAKPVSTSSSKQSAVVSVSNGPVARFEKCRFCGIVNQQNSMFCSSCGKKISNSVANPVCPKCKLSVNPESKFCLACGALVSSGSINQLAAASSANFKGFQDIPVVSTVEKQVQTTVTNLQIPNQSNRLSSTSPGKGFWRKQLEHILGHLREYTLQTNEFQQEISWQKFGKIISASVEDDDEVSTICIEFKLIADSAYGEIKSKYREAAKSYNKSRSVRSTSADSAVTKSRSNNSARSSASRPVAVNRPSRPRSNVPKLNEPSEELLKELQMPDTNLDVIKQCLEDGADANCKTSAGVPAIGLAVASNIFEAVKLLADAGADLNLKYASHGNTALHEAVTVRSDGGFQTVSALVAAGADLTVKNKRGETAHDLALRVNNAEAADLLAARMSHALLTAHQQHD